MRRLTLSLALTLLVSLLCAVPAQAASRYKIALHTDVSTTSVGRVVKVGGRVTGGPVQGRAVRLFWAVTSTPDDVQWHRFRTPRLSKNGYFRTTFRPPVGGTVRFLARKARVGSHASGVGRSREVSVYAWASLWDYEDEGGASIEDGPDGATVSQGTANVAGTSYRNALIIGDGASDFFFTHNEGCTALRGLVGVTTSSPRDHGTLRLTESGDLPATTAVTVSRARPLPLRVSLDGGYDLAVSAQIGTHDNGTDGGTANAVVLARPQALCLPAGV